MRFPLQALPPFRLFLLFIAVVAALSATHYQPSVNGGVWREGKAAWWDYKLLDWGLTGWGHAPRQPIAFSHKLHVGEYGLDCLYCHSAARVSPSAHLPPVQMCVGCHKKKTENPEIRKIQAYWKNQEPIPWIRVHKLPVFTHFNHKRHLRAGVECQSCHGAVKKMQRVVQVSSLKMGWCITCHEENQASRDCLVCHY